MKTPGRPEARAFPSTDFVATLRDVTVTFESFASRFIHFMGSNQWFDPWIFETVQHGESVGRTHLADALQAAADQLKPLPVH